MAEANSSSKEQLENEIKHLEFEIELHDKFYKPFVEDTGATEDIALTIVGFEFGDKVKVFWLNENTGEQGYTEITHELYNEKFRI